jgi:hypothetical protein
MQRTNFSSDHIVNTATAAAVLQYVADSGDE